MITLNLHDPTLTNIADTVKVPQMNGTLAAVTTFSNKLVNQDAVAMLDNAAAGIRGFGIGDGIGSHVGAEIGSRLAVEELAKHVGSLSHPSLFDMEAVCCKVCDCLDRYLEDHASDYPHLPEPRNSHGTTLLCALETPSKFVLGFVGNGAILHIRGNYAAGQRPNEIPWNVMNYLNPHTESRDGRNTLYKFLSPQTSGSRCMPTLITLSKDERYGGDIILVCSDGIHSNDQIPAGLDPDGNLWLSGNPSLRLLLASLQRSLTAGLNSDAELKTSLESYLEELAARKLVDDDCSIGMIVSARARSYFAGLRSNATDILP